MATPHRRLFGSTSRSFDVGGSVGMTSDPIQLKKSAKLSGIIMEINDLRQFAPGADRSDRTAGGFNFRPLATDPYPQISKNERRSALHADTIPHITGNAITF